MKKSLCLILLAFAASARAQINIDLVTIGYAGNPSDPHNSGSIPGIGAVAATYRIGAHEVTNNQYATFLNAVAASDPYTLYSPEMASNVFVGGIERSGSDGSYSYTVKSGYQNLPVGFVSFWDAARFSNWLHNGQGAGSTETGAYALNGVAAPTATVTRDAGAQWFIPSLNEWYKAAYYDPVSGATDGYWRQATRSDALGGNMNFALSNGANYEQNTGDANSNFANRHYADHGFDGPGVTPVGAYVNAGSFFGTYDQAGNLWEFTDTNYLDTNYHWFTGGSWHSPFDMQTAGAWGLADATEESNFNYMGFRVASVAAIPEPATGAILAGCVALGWSGWRRRRRAG